MQAPDYAPQQLLRFKLQPTKPPTSLAAAVQLLVIQHVLWLPSRRFLAEATVASEGRGERARRAAGVPLRDFTGRMGVREV